MWPELFGPGSGLGLLVAASVLAGTAAIVCFAMRTARPLGPDPVVDLWRRYEQGDLTSWEARRLFAAFEAERTTKARAAKRAAAVKQSEDPELARVTT